MLNMNLKLADLVVVLVDVEYPWFKWYLKKKEKLNNKKIGKPQRIGKVIIWSRTFFIFVVYHYTFMIIMGGIFYQHHK